MALSSARCSPPAVMCLSRQQVGSQKDLKNGVVHYGGWPSIGQTQMSARTCQSLDNSGQSDRPPATEGGREGSFSETAAVVAVGSVKEGGEREEDCSIDQAEVDSVEQPALARPPARGALVTDRATYFVRECGISSEVPLNLLVGNSVCGTLAFRSLATGAIAVVLHRLHADLESSLIQRNERGRERQRGGRES